MKEFVIYSITIPVHEIKPLKSFYFIIFKIFGKKDKIENMLAGYKFLLIIPSEKGVA